MANLNKVLLIGRLTRDPEVRVFTTGGKVASFGFAVNTRRKNAQSGDWEDAPVFLDVKAFNRAEGGRQLADLVEQYLKKGHQAYLEGHLVLEEWQDKNDGSKRQKLKIVLDNLQFLEPRADGGEGGARPPRAAAQPARQPAAAPAQGENFDEPEPDSFAPGGSSGGQGESEIPF